MGRPKFKIDEVQLKKLCERAWRCEDVSYILGCSYDTVERYIKKHYKTTFADFMDKTKASIRVGIFQSQVELAVKQKNPTMLIWLGKQMLGQSDQVQTQNENFSSQNVTHKWVVMQPSGQEVEVAPDALPKPEEFKFDQD